MMNETLALGECPIIRPEGIYLGGRRVIRIGMEGVGVGDVEDLLAYRQMWEPFIRTHLEQWRYANYVLENMPRFTPKCPEGIFNQNQIPTSLDEVEHEMCVYLQWSRVYSSDTYALGILKQWNAWSGKTSSEIVNGASEMLKWHQKVVMDVGGPYAEKLMRISKTLNLGIDLPEVPEFSLQQQIRAKIESAYITAKGVLQIVGYGTGDMLKEVGSTAEAISEGLSETASAVSKTASSAWTWIGVTAVLAVVGGTLIVYYHPRKA